jgi:hypothetical protein
MGRYKPRHLAPKNRRPFRARRTRRVTTVLSATLIIFLIAALAAAVIILIVPPASGVYAVTPPQDATVEVVEAVEHPGLNLQAGPLHHTGDFEGRIGAGQTVSDQTVTLKNDIGGGEELPENVRIDIVTWGTDVEDLPYGDIDIVVTHSSQGELFNGTVAAMAAQGKNIITPAQLQPGDEIVGQLTFNWPESTEDVDHRWIYTVVSHDHVYDWSNLDWYYDAPGAPSPPSP